MLLSFLIISHSLFGMVTFLLIVRNLVFLTPKHQLCNHMLFPSIIMVTHIKEYHKKFIFSHFDSLHSIQNHITLPFLNLIQYFMVLCLDEWFLNRVNYSILNKHLLLLVLLPIRLISFLISVDCKVGHPYNIQLKDKCFLYHRKNRTFWLN